MIQRKVIQPLIELLRQGISPEKLSLTIALGVSLGVVPMLGTTTLLCTLAAVALRLNLPAIQLVNGLIYPLQLILLVPFLRVGARLFGDNTPNVSVRQIFGLIHADVWHAIAALWVATMHALVAWLLFACVTSSLLYFGLVPVLNWLWVRSSARLDSVK